MKIFFRKNDLEKSLGNTKKQLFLIERTIKSLEDLDSDPRKSDEYDFRLGLLQNSMVPRFIQLVAETRVLFTFYLRPDRVTRLMDDGRTADLLAQLNWSSNDLLPLGNKLRDNVTKARTLRSVGERIKYVGILRLTVSGLKETFDGWAHILRDVMSLCTDRPGLRFIKALINSTAYVTITIGVLALVSRKTLFNLPEWFQMLIIFIVAVGIFVACLMGKPPKIALIDLA